MDYALIVFIITYVLMLIFSKYRTYVALGSALIFIVSGMLPSDQIFASIDFNVLLMVAPIALEICKKLKTNPVPFIISIAVSSNLQGAAILVGGTTVIMLGSYAKMSFLDFFWY